MDLYDINEDQDRFLLLKMSIEPETYRAVATALATPHPGRNYINLKTAIIKAFTDSEAMQIKSLLSGLQLGNRRPTQLLSEMCALYKGPKEKFFEELFLSRLPGNVRGILVSMRSQEEAQNPIEIIAQWADAITEQLNVPPIINNITEDTNAQSFKQKLDSLYEKIDAFTNQNNARMRSPFRSRSFARNNNGNTDSKENYDPMICFFHRKYGNNRHENRKCLNTCKLYKALRDIREKNQKN